MHRQRVGRDDRFADGVAARQLPTSARAEFAEACFRFVPMRARLDLGGWDDMDIFAH